MSDGNDHDHNVEHEQDRTHAGRCNRITAEAEHITAECIRATEIFSAFASGHEALGIIREEYLELEKEIFWGLKKANREVMGMCIEQETAEARVEALHRERMRVKATQLGAMALRFLVDFLSLEE